MAPRSILIFQTAFIGDVILTLPLVQLLRSCFPDAFIAFVAVPTTAPVLDNHPAVNQVTVYDKRGKDAGFPGILRTARRLREGRFEVALIPHRSLRSAVVVSLARVPRRIGFSSSSGAWLLTDVVPYDSNAHEIDRNTGLARLLGLSPPENALPRVYPAPADVAFLDEILEREREGGTIFDVSNLVALAPGSVWSTKRWPQQYYAALARILNRDGYAVAFVGSMDDRSLCDDIAAAGVPGPVLNLAGRLTLLQSAELLRRCRVLVSNDSAPMHLGVAVGTPVVAIYGPTVPRFGFAPRGPADVVAEVPHLTCRPCSIHGGDRCPLGTLACMMELTPEQVYGVLRSTLA